MVHVVAAQQARQHEGVSRMLHRRRHLHEQHRMVGAATPDSAAMAAVVETDAHSALLGATSATRRVNEQWGSPGLPASGSPSMAAMGLTLTAVADRPPLA